MKSVIAPSVLMLAATAGMLTASQSASATDLEAAKKAEVQTAYGKLPLHFEANQGQTNGQVKFLARGSAYTVFLTATEAVLKSRNADLGSGKAKPASTKSADPRSTVLRMQLVGANPEPRAAGLNELPGESHYFIGQDPKEWRTRIPTYAKVKYEAVGRWLAASRT